MSCFHLGLLPISLDSTSTELMPLVKEILRHRGKLMGEELQDTSGSFHSFHFILSQIFLF